MRGRVKIVARQGTDLTNKPERRRQMTSVSLSEFVADILRKNRIGLRDVQRLHRHILPDGLGSRGEVELLIGLERAVRKADAAWGRWLATSIADFVVWGERPTGIVDEDTAAWLAALLAGPEGEPSASAGLIAREIVEEAQAFKNDALAALARLGAYSRPTVWAAAPIGLAA
jgi:hypothetical protein